MTEPSAIHPWDTRPRRSGQPRVSRSDTRVVPLRLPWRRLNEIEELARQGYPHEVCGLLVGRFARDRTTVDRVTSAPNLAGDRRADRYVLDPDAFLAADCEARSAGLDVVGIWHTHPDHPARPSTTDRVAAWAGYSYLILEVRRVGVTDITAWRLDGESFVEQPIEETQR